jgi:hypothetical protein
MCTYQRNGTSAAASLPGILGESVGCMGVKIFSASPPHPQHWCSHILNSMCKSLVQRSTRDYHCYRKACGRPMHESHMWLRNQQGKALAPASWQSLHDPKLGEKGRWYVLVSWLDWTHSPFSWMWHRFPMSWVRSISWARTEQWDQRSVGHPDPCLVAQVFRLLPFSPGLIQ